MCGENYIYTLIHYIYIGSSPRVRGKRCSSVVFIVVSRLIPACAGKTGRPSSTTSAPWAHPRVCGENMRILELLARFRGSSPRVRGKPDRVERSVYGDGLTPACAGKTTSPTAASTSAWAHPRVCGENAP